MSGKKLRVAVIGCGKMGVHHLKAIAASEAAEVVAVVDPAPDRDRLRPVLTEGARILQSVDELIDSTQIDVAHIVTPPDTHVDLALKLLNAGMHVYVEKPFALRATDAERVLALADQKGLKVCAAHQVLFQEQGRKAQSLMPFIKDVVHVESYFSFKTVRASSDGKGAISPIDQLIDILPHPVYLMLSAMEQLRDDGKPLDMRSVQVHPDGDVHAIFRKGDTTGVLVVTLRGRPIESYLRVVGTNGLINADFVLSGVQKILGPGASAIALVLKPFSEARQRVFGTLATIWKMVFRKHKSYAGLTELIEAFYASVREGKPVPVTPESILETVRICESVGARLMEADEEREIVDARQLAEREITVPAVDPAKERVLVTGGTGFLGQVVVKMLRERGWPVRVIARRLPPYRKRIAGVEYVEGDIGLSLDPGFFRDVGTVAHLAAETVGGKDAHERNTIAATQRMIDMAADAGVRRFVNISSIAVLKPSSEVGGPLSESSPVDHDNIARGPYVWGKAEAERIVEKVGKERGVGYRTIRLGPLVDFRHFTPPGRLGREVGPLYVAMGRRSGKLSVCDVGTAGRVIVDFIEHFDPAPELLNLVEPDAPTRARLVELMRQERPELKVLWIPEPMLKLLSWLLKAILRLVRKGHKPLDLYSAFSAEQYDTRMAKAVIDRIGSVDAT